MSNDLYELNECVSSNLLHKKMKRYTFVIFVKNFFTWVHFTCEKKSKIDPIHVIVTYSGVKTEKLHKKPGK